MTKVGLLTRDPDQQGLGQGKTPATPGGGPSRRGGGAGEQGHGCGRAHCSTRSPSLTTCRLISIDALPSSPSMSGGRVIFPAPFAPEEALENNSSSSCAKALAEGRYHWHHDKALKAVSESIASAINKSKRHHAPNTVIPFIKAGETTGTSTDLLHSAPAAGRPGKTAVVPPTTSLHNISSDTEL